MNLESLVEQLLLEKLIKIMGPALYFAPAKLVVRGKIGESHFMLWSRLSEALAKKMKISPDKAEKIIDTTKPEQIVDGFITSEGKFVNREQAWQLAKKYNQMVKAMDSELYSGGEMGVPEMASEYL
jgi:hypothetical protein